MSRAAEMALPAIAVLFILSGVFKKVNVFDAFREGAAGGLVSLYRIAPSLIALVFAVKLLRGSGLIDAAAGILAPVLEKLGLPAEVLPLALLKPISGSGSTALLSDILEVNGPDSRVGLIASVLCCSSETTFYTIALYYGSCGVKKTGHTVFAALCADVASVIFSILFVGLLL